MIRSLISDLLGMLIPGKLSNLGIPDQKEISKMVEQQVKGQQDLTESMNRLNNTLLQRSANAGRLGIPTGGPNRPALDPFNPWRDRWDAFKSSIKAKAGPIYNPLSERMAAARQSLSTKAGNIAGDLRLPPGGKATTASGGMLRAAGLAGVVLGLVKLAVDLRVKVYDFAKGLSDANRNLSMFSGQMAASYSQMDLQKHLLDMSKANATAGSATNLNQALMDFNSEFAPISQDIASIKNMIGSAALQQLTREVRKLVFVWEHTGGKVVDWIEKTLGGGVNKDVAQPLAEWLDMIRKENPLPPRDDLPPIN